MATTRRGVLRAAAGAAVLAVTGCDAEPHQRHPLARGARPTARPSTGAPHPPTGPPRHLPPEVSRGPTTSPAVALTFHGAGDAATARRLLAEVRGAGARITVLAVGTWLEEQPGLAREILDGGHELGNHTHHHGPMSTMDGSVVHAEIEGCAALLRRLTGSAGSWFRPSQMRASTPLVRAQAQRAGYRTVLSYDVDSLDYTDPGPQAVTSAVLDGVGRGSVVSLHFGYDGTVRALPAILDGLRQRRLRAVTVGELLG